MTTATGDDGGPVHLVRIDAGRGMRRFYRVAVERDLFAGWRVSRAWGRIGAAGILRHVVFADRAGAEAAAAAVMAAKVRRGYRRAGPLSA